MENSLSLEFTAYTRLKCKGAILPGTAMTEPSSSEMMFEIKGYPHFIFEEAESSRECKCFFLVAKPFPSRNTAMCVLSIQTNAFCYALWWFVLTWMLLLLQAEHVFGAENAECETATTIDGAQDAIRLPPCPGCYFSWTYCIHATHANAKFHEGSSDDVLAGSGRGRRKSVLLHVERVREQSCSRSHEVGRIGRE